MPTGSLKDGRGSESRISKLASFSPASSWQSCWMPPHAQHCAGAEMGPGRSTARGVAARALPRPDVLAWAAARTFPTLAAEAVAGRDTQPNPRTRRTRLGDQVRLHLSGSTGDVVEPCDEDRDRHRVPIFFKDAISDGFSSSTRPIRHSATSLRPGRIRLGGISEKAADRDRRQGHSGLARQATIHHRSEVERPRFQRPFHAQCSFPRSPPDTGAGAMDGAP